MSSPQPYTVRIRQPGTDVTSIVICDTQPLRGFEGTPDGPYPMGKRAVDGEA